MGTIPIGSQKSDMPKTPTLRQYAKQNPDVVPNVTMVRIVFKPTKYPEYGLVVEHGFRVSVPEDSPLHGWLTTNMEDVHDKDLCLAVQVDDAMKGHWTLVQLDGTKCSWEETNYGWKVVATAGITRPKSKAVRS